MRRSAFAVIGSLFVTLIMAQPAHAQGESASYADLGDDLARIYSISTDPYYTYERTTLLPPNSAIGKVGYFDIIGASLSVDDGSYVFGMEVAGPLPEEGLVPGAQYVLWSFCPQFSSNIWAGGDVALLWDGTEYKPVFWDTREVEFTGDVGDIKEYGVADGLAFSTDGATLTISVPVELFGVDQFYWFFRTVVLDGQWDLWAMKYGAYWMVDMTDPEHAVSPYPVDYWRMPWLLWETE